MIDTATLTPDELILAAVLAYNAEYLTDPAEVALVASGTPVVDVRWEPKQNGWRVAVTVTPGIRLADGSFAAAAEPLAGESRVFQITDTLKTVKWLAGKLYTMPAGISVEYARAGR